ncbi:LemA family protein [Nocardia sp. NPDC127579]|uniref:LemA family protein n=1 Tax=Nocardia sp. NPDC127579 TaxID=3345402 RepID=UPI00363B4A58
MSALVITAVPVVVGLIALGWYRAAYNDFVRLRNLVTESWQQVDVELQRRHDLVPNLVATVEQAAAFEHDTLLAVTNAARAAQSGATGIDVGSRVSAENALTTALGRLHIQSVAYPAVQAVGNYRALQQELSDIEDRIAAARRLYNANVRALNTKIETVPATFVAARHRVLPAEYFETTGPGAHAVVEVGGLFSDRFQQTM